MFKLINAVKAMLGGKVREKAVRLGEAPEAHIEAYCDHQSYLWHLQDKAQLQAEREAAAKAWAKLSDEEQDEVIAWCDALNAQGRLEDHQFFDQWMAVRLPGYVGD